MDSRVVLSAAIVFLFCLPASGAAGEFPEDKLPSFVGSRACAPCHDDQYKSFVTYAKKSRSFESIKRLRKGLSEKDLRRCYGCHTTGYGQPGGFVSAELTPHLKNSGCEVCHGPGSIHAATGDPAAIRRRLTREICETCHTSERIKSFRYRPLLHGGGH